MILLLTLLVKSLLVFALAGAVLLALRRASAAARHLVCVLTLAGLLALPLFSVTLPGWHLGVLEPTPTLTPPETGRVRVGAGLAPALNASPALGTPSYFETPPTPRKPSTPEPLRPPVSGGTLRSNLLRSKEVGFLTLYLLGVLLASLRPMLGLWGIARLSRLCLDIQDPPTLAASAHCAELLHLRLMPRLCRADVAVPMTWGWHRPVVLLPTESTEWPADRLQSVLLHEMAHIKHRDWLSHRLADLVCAVYWFHPLVWLTARRLRIEGELACDDLVLTSGIAASDYARHLLEIAGTLRPASTSPYAAIAMAQTSHVEGRILMILDKAHSRRLNHRAFYSAAALGFAALIVVAVLRPDTRALAAITIAQTHFAGNVPVTFAGVTDGSLTGNQWWSADGKLQPYSVYRPSSHDFLSGKENHHYRRLIFAFRLPPAAKDVTTEWELPGSQHSSSQGTWITKMVGHDSLAEAKINVATGGTRTVSALYPSSISKADVKLRVASGPWTTEAALPVRDGQYGATKSIHAQTFIFSPITQSRFSPSGSKWPAITITAANVSQDIRIIGIDSQGHNILPSSAGDQKMDELDQIDVEFATVPTQKIVKICVQTRPYHEIEFKNVALQPVK